jgi:hypothetical protein
LLIRCRNSDYCISSDGLRVYFGGVEGIVLSVLSSDENSTKLSLRVPCLIGPPPLMSGAGAISVNILSDGSPIYCDSGSVPCNVSTDGANLRIYAPIRGVSVTPSKVSEKPINASTDALHLQLLNSNWHAST